MKRAFTLLEVLISLAIVTVTILLITAIFSSLLFSGKKTGDLTAGSLVARSVLAEWTYSQLDNDADKAAFFSSANGTTARGVENLQGNQFNWVLTHSQVDELSEQNGVMNTRTRLITVQVYWFAAQGQGELRTYLSRLVNEQDAR